MATQVADVDVAAMPFLLAHAGRELVARGVNPAPSTTGLVVGALPFSRDVQPHLWSPASAAWRSADQGEGGSEDPPYSVDARSTGSRWRVTAEPPRDTYERSVAVALRLIEAGSHADPLHKVVLARTLLARSTNPIDIGTVLHALRRDRRATTFAVPLPTTPGKLPCVLVGASPELLLQRAGRSITSAPLAGSARRHDDPVADRAVADALLNSEKDSREHQAVVEWIASHLAPFCDALDVPARPSVVCTDTMWHLKTVINGTLRADAPPAVDLARLLHPTPAICGVPFKRALRVIDDLEPHARGFFGGAVGWSDHDGDGQWWVAIRCAEICDNSARLWAGAGIVAGSDPAHEADETFAKFQTLLRALEVPPDAIGDVS